MDTLLPHDICTRVWEAHKPKLSPSTLVSLLSGTTALFLEGAYLFLQDPPEVKRRNLMRLKKIAFDCEAASIAQFY